MSNYQLYQEVLTSAGHGTPLWEPSSSTSQTSSSIGDVGYFRFGAFIRLFNATLPPGHCDNENGEPDNYVPLAMHTTQVRRTVLPKGIVATSGVQVSSLPQDETDDDPRIIFKCTDKVGAVVMTESDVVREDAVSLEPFADYIATHARSWVNFARHRLMREVASHELILLTGCDLTKGRYSVTVFAKARPSSRLGHGASFELSHPASKIRAWSHPPSIRYFQHNYGPPRSCHPTAQCLFVRGYRILDSNIEEMEREHEVESCVVDICGVGPSRGPVDAVLRYLSDKSNANIAIAHDLEVPKLLEKGRVPYDYRCVLKRLRKTRQPLVVRGRVACLA